MSQLAEQFQEKAEQFQGKPGPKVLVYIGNDDPTRGDSHGFKGIGEALARKLNGEFDYLENSRVRALYPKEKLIEKVLRSYFKDYGAPDIVLSTQWHFDDFDKLGLKKHPLVFSSFNESLSYNYLNENALVAHHLTPELLAEEGQKFRERYPGLPRPLIAVMMVSISDVDAFVSRLVSKCAAYPEATVFVCGCRRTPEKEYNRVVDALSAAAKKKGLGDRLKITGYSFKARGEKTVAVGFNPYVGLVNEADHIIICGHSQSLLSESLVKGKPALMYEAWSYDAALEKKGLTLKFNDCAADTRFDDLKVDPVNTTEKLAEALAKEYEKTLQQEAEVREKKLKQEAEERELKARQSLEIQEKKARFAKFLRQLNPVNWF